jgi:hypothetical protein
MGDEAEAVGAERPDAQARRVEIGRPAIRVAAGPGDVHLHDGGLRHRCRERAAGRRDPLGRREGLPQASGRGGLVPQAARLAPP